MRRKRFTELFPFLLPLRKFQRKIFFYLKMYFDSNIYSKKKLEDSLEYEVFSTKSNMINHNSGYDIQYQINKVDNLKLAASTINNIVIEPGETFSFWMLVKNAERYGKYKDGLVVVNDNTVPQKGGGLCQISNMLFYLFLHTPLTIVERHPHSAETIPHPKGDIPVGVDATIAEGWKDLKVKNETDESFQILIEFDEETMYGAILSNKMQYMRYEIESSNIRYTKENSKIYRYNDIYRVIKLGDIKESKELILNNKYEIRYDIESEIGILN